MILNLPAFTAFHTALSLIAIVAGIVVVAGLFGRERQPVWTALFLASALLTSATGFGFPATQVTPAHVLGVLSLIAVAAAGAARYRFRLVGIWRRVYAINAVAVLYFQVFVLIAQAFLKVGLLNQLAPTLSEPPFAIAQGIALVFFLLVGIAAVLRRRHD